MLKSLQNRMTATVGGRWAAMVIGTFLGTLPGVLAQSILSNLGWISSLTGLVVISGAIGGYLWSRMPLRLPGFLYIAVLSAVMILAGEVLAVWAYGVYYFCKVYGAENFWAIAAELVPQVMREDPEFATTILLNGGLSVLLAVPVGIFEFLSASRAARAASGEGTKRPPLALRPCRRDHEGNPYLATSGWQRGFMFVMAVVTAPTSLIMVYAALEGGEGLGTGLALGLFILACCLVFVYFLTVRYTLTDQGLVIQKMFFKRTVPYEDLRGPSGQGKMLLEGAAPNYSLTLPGGEKSVCIRVTSAEGMMEFLEELKARTHLELPWNYAALLTRGML